MDAVARGLGAKANANAIDALRPCPLPAGEFDDMTDMFLPADFKMWLQDAGPDNRAHGTCNYTREALFDLRSTARSAPTNTYFVDPVNGSDSNNGLTEGTAFQSGGKAINTGKVAAAPFKIKWRGGGTAAQDAVKAKNFSTGSLSANYDSDVDFCVEFYNGLSFVGSHVDFSAPSLHSGATSTYAIADTSTDNILDRRLIDKDGVATPLAYVPYITSGDLPPGCWSTNQTTTIVRLFDSVPVTNTNTRLIQSVPNLRCTHNISIGFFPATEADTMIIEGGGGTGNGPFDITVANTETDLTVRAVITRNVRVVNYGFLSTGSGRGFSVDGIHGLVFLDNYFAGRLRSDGVNKHNTRRSTGGVTGVLMRVLTMNGRVAGCGVDVRGRASPVSGTTTSGSASVTFGSSVKDINWRTGMTVTGTGIPASTTISTIASDGLSITMSANATASGTVTVTPSVTNVSSCNGLTAHDDGIKWIDLASDLTDASGGAVRNIGSSKMLLLGTKPHDKGDRWLGSTTRSTGIRTQDTAKVWAWRVRMPDMPPGSIAYHADDVTNHIYLRDCWPTKGGSIGTIETW